MADLAQYKGKTAVIVVAAGRGSRAGAGAPKQFRNLMGKSVIIRTLEAVRAAFDESEQGALIVPVIHTDDQDTFRDSVGELSDIADPVIGGATRQESVRNALESLTGFHPDIVLIHDAARPFVSRGLIVDLLSAYMKTSAGVVPALAVVDTLVRQSGDSKLETVSRDDLYAVQTPQVFKYDEILAAHQAAERDGYTDDASVFVANGGEIVFSKGQEQNFKITTAEDFLKAEHMILKNYTDVRVGSGYDVHRFEPGNSVRLGGVDIPFDKKLKGHSDADVALHALTDAILAAIADGDIGTHFPPSDEKWRGAASDKFLSFASTRVRDHGGMLSHLAVTIICEAPKIGSHAMLMRERIAAMAGIDVSRVSIQATTTERLGFTGRGEGIAAQATATVKLPDRSTS